MAVHTDLEPIGVQGASTRGYSLSELAETGYILVVDDDENICDVMALILSEEGYDVTCIREGATALRMIQERPPSLILLDLSLTNPSAEDLIATYRRTAGGSAAVIVVSGRANIEQHADSIGADGFLPKPFDVPILVDMVQAILVVRSGEDRAADA